MRPALRRMPAMLMCVALIGTGCGTFAGSQSTHPVKLPSNRTLAVEAVVAAFDRVPVTIERGEPVAFIVEATGDTASIAREAVRRVLDRHGAILSDDPSLIPRLTVRVESLAVRLIDRYTGIFRRENTRSASAEVTVIWTERAGVSGLYTGAGNVEDRIPSGDTMPDDMSEPFVYVEHIEHPARVVVKPAVLLAAMTAFLWTLYSYRG